MLWINFLHLYQPATLDKGIIMGAIDRSYTRLIKALLKNREIKFTLSISGCLLEKLEEFSRQELLDDIKKLIERKQVELVGTAAYHPILPLIPREETERQVKLQEELIKKYFPGAKLKGFFLPEMAYSAEIAKIIKELGYEWIILDEIAGAGELDKLDCRKIYTDSNSGLAVIFRQREYSKSYVPQLLAKIGPAEKKTAIITATDAELYGLHHNDISGHLEKLLKNPNVETATISEYIKNNPPERAIKIMASSWESNAKELNRRRPYVLWHNEKNKIQMKLWKLANLAWETVDRHQGDPQYQWAYWHLRRGLASCTFWWASGHNFKNLMSTFSWSPDEIERGLNELIRSIRTLDDAATRATKIKAEKLYLKIKKLIWKKHWKYYWKRK
ncbi:hypothetical protein COT99_00675 [Candidatus Falkowbacteria bacterium CG10_big_fil_rev_8_21_14_0_10_43_10]|uniref:Glycoside hydrolase family 57 N-terminal domain-containing protein n=1 Tax=Candidatus Falkowbacteria bacterium CG10_big_fil_rev_8_21_14_0_10_43_10 TaxID=1974567 RepID=A0A2H0V2W5_9BACT|nr:MAG: hypothetical protein COT99_00675 [Candidatus Falkowbacteria bacterium CG10_big_fil_rev_8_21_14_0_10_43_10]